jgi:hypothetical protein
VRRLESAIRKWEDSGAVRCGAVGWGAVLCGTARVGRGGGQTHDWGLQSTTVCDFMGQVESPILKQIFGVHSGIDVMTSYESRWRSCLKKWA